MAAAHADTRACDLVASSLHASLEDPALESMNFLNEVGGRYPDAVSFASGRPTEGFFDVALIHEYIDGYCRYLRGTRGFSREQVSQALFQYGPTKGIVNELIARQLATDEGIEAGPEAMVVTVGRQPVGPAPPPPAGTSRPRADPAPGGQPLRHLP